MSCTNILYEALQWVCKSAAKKRIEIKKKVKRLVLWLEYYRTGLVEYLYAGSGEKFWNLNLIGHLFDNIFVDDLT